MLGYFILLPILLIIGFSFIDKNHLQKRILAIYTIVMSFLYGFIAVSDMKLYSYWDLKMDSEIFKYLQSISQVGESISFFDVFLPDQQD